MHHPSYLVKYYTHAYIVKIFLEATIYRNTIFCPALVVCLIDAISISDE